jgi:hypothetical protein
MPDKKPQTTTTTRIDIHHYIHNEEPGSAVQGVLTSILTHIGALEAQGAQLMVTVADIKAAADTLVTNIADESTVDDSIIALLEGITTQNALLRQQLADAIAAGADPVALQAVLDNMTAANAAVEANKAKIVAAVTAGTQTPPA